MTISLIDISGGRRFGKYTREELIALLIFLFYFCSVTYAEENIFTNSMEEDLYSAIKDRGKSHSEAEIEQGMGTGLLNYDNQWERAEKHFKRAVKLDPKLYWC